jgi:hypothetical protein
MSLARSPPETGAAAGRSWVCACRLEVSSRVAITRPEGQRVEIGAALSFQWTAAKEARTYRLLYRRRLGPNETVLASPAPRLLSGTAAPTASPTAYRATFGPKSATPPPTYGAGVMDVLGGTAGGRRRQEASCLINGELEVDLTVRAHTSAGLVLGDGCGKCASVRVDRRCACRSVPAP